MQTDTLEKAESSFGVFLSLFSVFRFKEKIWRGKNMEKVERERREGVGTWAGKKTTHAKNTNLNQHDTHFLKSLVNVCEIFSDFLITSRYVGADNVSAIKAQSVNDCKFTKDKRRFPQGNKTYKN